MTTHRSALDMMTLLPDPRTTVKARFPAMTCPCCPPPSPARLPVRLMAHSPTTLTRGAAASASQLPPPGLPSTNLCRPSSPPFPISLLLWGSSCNDGLEKKLGSVIPPTSSPTLVSNNCLLFSSSCCFTLCFCCHVAYARAPPFFSPDNRPHPSHSLNIVIFSTFFPTFSDDLSVFHLPELAHATHYTTILHPCSQSIPHNPDFVSTSIPPPSHATAPHLLVMPWTIFFFPLLQGVANLYLNPGPNLAYFCFIR